MKITFRNQKGEIIKAYNDPFGRELSDVIVKPLSKIVKILYVDGRIEEYTLLDRTYEVINDLQNDLEEIRVRYMVQEIR